MGISAAMLHKIGAELPNHGRLPSDEKARRETKELFGDERRNETAKQHLHKIFILFIWFAGFAFIALFVVRMWHFGAPESLCWLKDDRIQNIDKSLFSGAIGGLIMNHIRQTLPGKPKSDE